MLTVEEIKKITKGKLLQGDAERVVKGVSIDSRVIKKGKLEEKKVARKSPWDKEKEGIG